MRTVRLLMAGLMLGVSPLAVQATYAAPQGRLIMARPKQPDPAAPPGPPSDQTVYFGPKTLGGFMGADLCQGACTLPVTVADTANYYWDSTQDAQGLLVPKSSGAKVYGAVRGSPLSGCEDGTLTDAAGHVVTFHACA